MKKTEKLELLYLEQHQVSKEIVINENYKRIDSMLTLVVKDILNIPPNDPSDGDLFLVGCAPSAQWVGKRYHLALYSGNNREWIFWGIRDKSSLFIISHREWYTFGDGSIRIAEQKPRDADVEEISSS